MLKQLDIGKLTISFHIFETFGLGVNYWSYQKERFFDIYLPFFQFTIHKRRD